MKELNLRFFQSVATTGTLSAAAEELHVAVSAVSRQISNLESQLGLKLFERRPRGMSLTEAGEVLLAYALRNQLEVNEVLSKMRGIDALQQHRIRVACPDGLGWHFLPSVIGEFRSFHPGVKFDLQVVDSARASELVKEGAADIAITFSLAPMIGVEVVANHAGAICALMPSAHPLASRSQLSVTDLKGYPLALPLNGTTMRYLFDIACNVAGITVVPDFSCDSLGAIYAMVRKDNAMVTLCGAASVRDQADIDSMVLIPMSDAQLRQRSLQIQVMAGRRLPQIIQYFVHFLEEQLLRAEAPDVRDNSF
ncbi:LysR family transcriptional regulator [Marinobacterium lacunae]|nr:LysR family transcriptional regulator [Marinobacterium lacunae]